MSMTASAIPAMLSNIQLLRDVSSRCLAAIAKPISTSGNPKNKKGARNTPRMFGKMNVDAQTIAANEGAVSIRAVERRTLKYISA